MKPAAVGTAVAGTALALFDPDPEQVAAAGVMGALTLRKAPGRDAFFTAPKTADKFASWVKSTLPEGRYSFVEPSAGEGAIKKHFHSAKAYDISPQGAGIEKADFLKKDLGYKPGRVFVGNPPFGSRGDLAKAFIEKAMKEGDYAAFILPRGFASEAFNWQVKGGRPIAQVLLPEDSFVTPEGQAVSVPTIAQIWKRGESLPRPAALEASKFTWSEGPEHPKGFNTYIRRVDPKIVDEKELSTGAHYIANLTREEKTNLGRTDWGALDEIGTGHPTLNKVVLERAIKGEPLVTPMRILGAEAVATGAAVAGTAIALDQMSSEEIAGLSTAAILVAGRPKTPGGMWHPEAVKRLAERGSATTDMLTSIALIGGGAALMAAADPENLGKRALQGAALGLGVRMFPWGRAGEGMDKGLGLMSTRVKNIAPELHQRWITFEQQLLSRMSAMKSAADPFLVQLNKVPSALRSELNRAILTNDPLAINAAIAATGDAKLAQGWRVVRAMLQQTGDILQSKGRLGTLLEDYFPRVIKDQEGLMKALGQDVRGQLEFALMEAEDRALKTRGSDLTQLERSRIINDYLLAPLRKGSQPGWAKGRTIPEITKAMEPFYLNATDSLHAYIRSAALDIEKAKFFGKDTQTVKQSGQQYINLDASIGNVVQRVMDENRLPRAQAIELSAMLKSRFGPGERVSRASVQDVRNVTNALLLGNPLSAVVQLGDLAASVAVHGWVPTLQSLNLVLTGRATIRPKDIGLINHIGEEFVTNRSTAKFLQGMLKYSGFSGVDYLGKVVNLNAAKVRFEKLARSQEGQAYIASKYGASFGADLPQLIQDLQGGKLTPATRSFYFGELSRVQPISKFEIPQMYLENPDIGKALGGLPIDARSFYQLKSFMLKQADLIRRESYNEIKSGNRAKGLGNLIKFSLALGISGAAPAMIQDFLMGRPYTPEWDDIPMNALRNFGWSQYTLDKAKKGKFGEVLGSLAIPPYQLYEELVRADPKAIKYLPLIGKVLFQQEWTEEGKQRGEERRSTEALRKVDRELLPWIGDPDAATKREIRERKRDVRNTSEYREMARERKRRREEREAQ